MQVRPPALDGRRARQPDPRRACNMTAPSAIPIGTQMLHATGIAWAFKLRKEDQVVATVLRRRRDQRGRLPRGDELRQRASRCPASSSARTISGRSRVPREQQMNSRDRRAEGPRLRHADVIQVDGNDIFAVYKVAKEARRPRPRRRRPHASSRPSPTASPTTPPPTMPAATATPRKSRPGSGRTR